MLDTKYFCDLCGSETRYIYDPINTKRGMKLFICKKCGCLQSLSFKNYPSRPEGNMSSDADRASYKYTKTLALGQYSTLLNKFCLNINTSNILDIGMNRGAFYKWATRNFIYEKFTGIETDASLTDEYCNDKKVNLIIDRVENVDLGSQIFDFAFCVHTLEHVKSANSVLRQVFRALKHGGVFFLAVPNIIFHDDIVEEYFIDTHTFHFQYDILLNFIKNTGFRVKYCSEPFDSEIIFILEKKHKNYLKNDKIKMNERYDKVLMELRKYEDKIHINRELISSSVTQINKYCLEKRKCFIWGAGRIIDCLIKFGRLKPNDYLFLIDKYLSDIISNSNGFKIYKPKDLVQNIDENSIVYIASRRYRNEIQNEAKKLGIRKAIYFGSDGSLKDI